MDNIAFVIGVFLAFWFILHFHRAGKELDQFFENELRLKKYKSKLMVDKIGCLDCIAIKTERGKTRYLCRERGCWVDEEFCLQCYRPKAQKLSRKLFNGDMRKRNEVDCGKWNNYLSYKANIEICSNSIIDYLKAVKK